MATLSVAQLQALYALILDSRPDKVIISPCDHLVNLVSSLLKSPAGAFEAAR